MTDRTKQIETIFRNMQLLRRGFGPHHPRSRAHSVTFSQIGILFLLQDHGALRNAELAKLLGISPSAATQLLAGLEAQGFVEREQASSDRRAASISIAKKGARHIERLRRRRVDEFYQIFSVLSDDEIEQLVHITAKLANSVRGERE